MVGWNFSAGADYTRSSSDTSSRSSGTERSSTSVRRLGDQQYKELSATMRALQGELDEYAPQYSKEAAVRDTKGLVDSIFQQYRETDLPNILQQQGQAGAYSSTGTQQLANDAYARTTTQASSAVLQAISQYADIQNQRRSVSSSALSNVLSGLLAAREDTTSTSAFNTTAKSKTTGKTTKLTTEGGWAGS
jgi:hypothetical protein